jgi:glycosyltransferase involved in cell wall biosynthesis
MRILYTCPLAHYEGHYPYVALKETSLLSKSSLEVHLLTFKGILNEAEPQGVTQHRVLSRNKIVQPLAFLLGLGREHLATKWLLMFGETVLTLVKALWLRRKLKCDIIHVRDGEPFFFISLVLSFFAKRLNWLVCLVTNPNSSFFHSKNAAGIARTLGLNFLHKIINARLWRSIYQASISRNHFLFLTLNEQTKNAYENYHRGVFRGRIKCVPLGAEKSESRILKEEARDRIKLSEINHLILSFGVIHSGKDLKVVLEAIKNIPDLIFMQAGKILPWQVPDLESYKEVLSDKIIVRDYYIPEVDKKYYFCAADAVVLSYVRNFTQSASLLWEACRFGTPVVASDCGELGNLVRAFDIGLLFEPQNVNSLQKAIIDFTNLSSNRKREMVENCKKFVTSYSNEKWVQDILGLYQELMDSTPNCYRM